MDGQSKSLRMASQQPLMTFSELQSLPERLTDDQLHNLLAIAREPLKAPEACDPKHFAQCFKFMVAVLPKQAKDEIDGKLFVAAYQRMLGGYPKDAISYLAEHSMAQCRWFPTIAECIDILQKWQRDDDDTRYRNKVLQIVRREQNARREDAEKERRKSTMRPITMAEISTMSESLISLGIEIGALKKLEDGTVVPNEEPEE